MLQIMFPVDILQRKTKGILKELNISYFNTQEPFEFVLSQ